MGGKKKVRSLEVRTWKCSCIAGVGLQIYGGNYHVFISSNNRNWTPNAFAREVMGTHGIAGFHLAVCHDFTKSLLRFHRN